MRVYLLNPPFLPNFGRGARWQEIGRAGTLYYPIWLSYAAANISRNHEITLIDAVARKWDNENVLDDIILFHPDIIIIDSSFPSLNNDIHIAEEIKKNFNNLITILVGPPSSQYPDRILESIGVDIVARGEYDFTLKELADKINNNEKLTDVSGISYKNNNKIIHNPNKIYSSSEELDCIPFVSKIYQKYLNIEDYFLGQSLFPEVQIFTGRGCPNQCTFCSWPQTLMGRKYRTRTISNVLDEVEWIQNNLSVKEIFFEDDTFSINKKRVHDFCNGYLKRKLCIIWACNARADTLDLETMKLMKKANCRLLISGFESGSQEILKSIKKGITVDQIKKFSANAKMAGLLVHADFIIGLPGETTETIELTKSLIKEIKPDILQVAVASPFPGTEFYDYCKANGYLLSEDPNEYLDETGHQKAIISYPNLTNEEMVNAVDKILKEYYISLRYIPLVFVQVIRKNGFEELKRIWSSTKMFLRYIFNRN